MLPDEVLLMIFCFCADEDSYTGKDIQAWWQSLVHVCRRWRTVVFGSPRRLNLRLVFTPETPRDLLDIWPGFPLVVWDDGCRLEGLDDIITLLDSKHGDRVCQIGLIDMDLDYFHIFSATTEKPFSQLTDLTLSSRLSSTYGSILVVPDSFLGPSAPRLRNILLNRISFPGLPTILMSTTYLVSLRLLNTPSSGYIPPEEMLAALSTLTSLETLHLRFHSPPYYSDWTNQCLPPRRIVLPVLTLLKFKGTSNYLEVLLAWIDAPQLGTLFITFTSPIASGTPQLIQFTHRTPRLKALEKARVFFDNAWPTKFFRVNFSSQTSELNVGIICTKFNQILLSLEQVFSPSLSPLSTLEDLYIFEAPQIWQFDFKKVPWPELLHPFTAVKNLYLSRSFVPYIVPALQKLVGGRSTEVLPSLENIFLETLEPLGPGIGRLIAARQATGHAIAITCWEGREEIEDYREDDDDDMMDDDNDDDDDDDDDNDNDNNDYDDDIDEDDEEDLYDDDDDDD